MFDIPIVLFTFKRKDTVKRIIERISVVKPKKLYIISDGPRNEEESSIIDDTRSAIEGFIDWDCEIVKNYAETNQGVYNRIGEGAKWVFSQEEKAIFLEDDNLPAVSFFKFCEELLNKYDYDNRILWICGTNYLKEYLTDDDVDYVFTKQMLPCGWASWSHKFCKYFDGEMELLSLARVDERLSLEYFNKRLYRQDLSFFYKTKYLLKNNKKLSSWDRQMAFSVRIHSMYGIAPVLNQIENIGADNLSTHGGTSLEKEMTGRFCGIPTKEITFPLRHPKVILRDYEYERKISNIILLPLKDRIGIRIMSFLKPLFGLDRDASFMMYLRSRFGKK